jgi:hypothetical protein
VFSGEDAHDAADNPTSIASTDSRNFDRGAIVEAVLPILEITLQRHIQRRLQREGWKVAPAVTIRAKHGGAFRCRIDLHADRPRRGLMIEVKPNWPPYQAIGQSVYYYYAVKRERKLSLPKDLALAMEEI